MTTRALLLLAALTLGACAPSAPKSAVAIAPSAIAPKASPKPQDPLGMKLAAEVSAKVSPAMYAADLHAVARPRHYLVSPRDLAAVADYVAKTLGASGFRVQRQRVSFDGVDGVNIIADRAGERPDVVLACAHYDAVEGTQGADDNATGVAAILGIARAVSGTKTRSSLRIVAFAFEEQGLIGSRAYIDSLSPAERSRITGVFNVEMIGYTSHAPGSQRFPEGFDWIAPAGGLPTVGDFLGVAAIDGMTAPLDALYEARPLVPGLKVADVTVPRIALAAAPDLLRSDHAPFWLAGVPAIMVGDTAELRSPHYHQWSDRISTLDMDFAVSSTRLLAGAITLLASRVR